MHTQEYTDIMKILHFLQDHLQQHMATKDDLHRLEERMEEKFDRKLFEMKQELMTHIDGLAVSFQRFDQELVACRARDDRIEARLEHHIQTTT